MKKKRGTIPRKVGEEWKLVDGTEDYWISNFGRFRHGKKLMKLAKDKSGYLTCNVGHKRPALHRLVALAFVPNPDNKPVVDHIDGDKLNCNATNLRWVTHSENTQAAYDMGLIKARRKLPVIAIDDEGNAMLFSSQKEAAIGISADSKLVNQAIRGLIKKIKGYRFIKINSLVDKRGLLKGRNTDEMIIEHKIS